MAGEMPSRPMRGRRGWAKLLIAVLGVVDAAVIGIAILLAHAVRFETDAAANVVGPHPVSYTVVSIALGVGWWIALGIAGSREVTILGHGPQELQRVVTSVWQTFAVVALIGFLTKSQISRGFLLAAAGIGLLLLLVARSIVRLTIHRLRDRERLQANVILVGPVPAVRELDNRFRGGRRAGFRVVAVASAPGVQRDWTEVSDHIVRLGELNDPVAQARSVAADYIVVAGSEGLSFQESRKLGWALEGTELGLMIAPSLVDVAGPRVAMSPVAGLPLLQVSAPTFGGARWAVKALLDRSGGLLLIVLAAIPMLLIGLVVRLTSPGPALFVQERVGLGMRSFRMYKFRSMYVDAEQRLDGLLAQNEGDGVRFKLREDPRVTAVGRFLRRYSLDELPQLFNVVKGDMSLVGPRPPLAREVEHWESNVERRQLVKPGLTGLWQVSGRSDLSWEESVRLDLYYVENWSLGGDFIILARTLYSIIRPRGAY